MLPAYTCFSVPAAVLNAGLIPAPCDIDSVNFDFDHALLEETVGADTLCVVAHHLFGIPSDVERVRALCRERNIFVVEDAAQAMGVESNGRKLGTIGDVGIFSLGRGKNITCGSGGIILTNSDKIATAIDSHYRDLPAPSAASALRELAELVLMTVFIRPRLYWIPAAIPFLRLDQTIFTKRIQLARLSGMKAAVLRMWRCRLAHSNRIRSESAAYFEQRIPLRLAAGPSHPYLRLPILLATVKEKNRLHSMSQARGLGLSVVYPRPVSEIPEVRYFVNGKRFPTARRVANRLLTIPTHHWLSDRDKSAIARLCQEARAS